MVQLINDIIELNSNNYFEFTNNTNNPVVHLKEQTQFVPNTPGLYLVFRENNLNVNQPSISHLNYLIQGEKYELLYFGKAGGLTQKGKVIKQGLKGRINNVISDSFRDLKDIKRANYWSIIMNEFNINQLRIIYSEVSNPQDFENIIYNYLDNNNLKYPLLNKKRGR
jgi:hypothetical protein